MSATRPKFAGDEHPGDTFTTLIVSARDVATALANAADTDSRQGLLDQHARILRDLCLETAAVVASAASR